MAANRKRPTMWKLADIGIAAADLQPGLELVDLFVPVSDQQCEFIEGANEQEIVAQLVQKLREAHLI
jgi:electron transfer flavoprotein alpha/beta subunit